jgi:hypothetical protein
MQLTYCCLIELFMKEQASWSNDTKFGWQHSCTTVGLASMACTIYGAEFAGGK